MSTCPGIRRGWSNARDAFKELGKRVIAAIPRGLGFRGSEKPPLPFIEMRLGQLPDAFEDDWIDKAYFPIALGNVCFRR
jgi:hypothetical protein